MNKLINKKRLDKANRLGKNIEEQWDFNCWGATLFILDKIKQLLWVENDQITTFLEDETEEVSEAVSGDILVLYKGKRVSHTAIYITDKELFHKVGGIHSEFTTFEGVRKWYFESKNYAIRRINN